MKIVRMLLFEYMSPVKQGLRRTESESNLNASVSELAGWWFCFTFDIKSEDIKNEFFFNAFNTFDDPKSIQKGFRLLKIQ